MKCRYCKCGNEMLVIKKEFAWYWGGKCGRFLNGDQHLDPGDEWFEPLSSDAVLAEVRADVAELFSAITSYMAITGHCFESRHSDFKDHLLTAMKKVSEHFS